MTGGTHPFVARGSVLSFVVWAAVVLAVVCVLVVVADVLAALVGLLPGF